MKKIINEADFKVKQLTKWGLKKYILDQDRVDIKLSHVWIETKQKSEDIYDMLAQIIFTAHKCQGYRELPIYFGCFNSEKGAIIENYQVMEVFAHTDINWTQAPSKLDRKTVDRIKFLIKSVQEYGLDEFGKKLKEIEEKGSLAKLSINKNNFIIVYDQWLKEVGNGIESYYFADKIVSKADCYLADLMTDGKRSIAEKLKVVLGKSFDDYQYEKVVDGDLGRVDKIKISDQKAYKNFWSKYERPPAEEYQEYILSRRDLLQPINIREVKGAYFTPKVWCDASKEYLARAFGEGWQDEYYIWDCCCGTGNLERGLTNPQRVFMSTLDDADLDIMKQLNTIPDAVHFQFDFLQDDWKPKSQGGKIPDSLWKIMQNEQEKLIIYINPPYLEAANRKVPKGAGKNRSGATASVMKEEMETKNLGKCSNELFAQFYYRIYKEMPAVKIGSFSTLKNCISPNFEEFRRWFKAEFLGGFICRGDSFDNVKGQFPISFQIWDCAGKKEFPREMNFDILEKENKDENCGRKQRVGVKKAINVKEEGLINGWFASNNKSPEDALCYVQKKGSDFQNQNYIALYKESPNHGNKITKGNILRGLVYVAVRLCIPATWLNDRDQFTAPRKAKERDFSLEHENKKSDEPAYEYESDEGFVSDCVVYSLFKKNYTDWQLFPNSEIGLQGVERDMRIYNLLLKDKEFSLEAKKVLDLAREIYRVYHGEFRNPSASWDLVKKSLRDSGNITYLDLKGDLGKALDELAMEIALGVHKYGFLGA